MQILVPNFSGNHCCDAQDATSAAPNFRVLMEPGALMLTNNSTKHGKETLVGVFCDTVLKQTAWTLLLQCVAEFTCLRQHGEALTRIVKSV